MLAKLMPWSVQTAVLLSCLLTIGQGCRGHFQCRDGSCVLFPFMCDLIISKASREVQPCSMYETRCDPSDLKSHCIPNSWFCDGKVDCDNGFDELQCHNTGKSIYSEVAHKLAVNGTCDVGYFRCDQHTVCIPWLFVCDGTSNCADRSDENPDCMRKCSCKNNGKCYLDQTTNTWACECPPKFEGRNCNLKRSFTATII